ncbi:MAG: hypothetical protein PHU85_19955, partial [Phycisphaerae bacterium]|nr:hypothetical protein [Phycisphaerae bacterium]
MTRWLTIVPLLALALGGCDFGHRTRTPPPLPPMPEPADRLPLAVGEPASQPDGAPDPIVSQVAFVVFCDVLMVDVPAGSLSSSAELWSRVREDTLGVKRVDA